MENNLEQVKEFSVKNLLSNSGEYVIPVYQRNYAWEEPQIRQLVKDVIDSINKDERKKYYIGTLIVDKTKIDNVELLETIDGQQRLTTLNIIAIALKKHKDFKKIDTDWFKYLNLSFSNRPKSEITLQDLFNNVISKNKKYNTSILHAHDLVISILNEELLGRNITIEKFTHYLFHYVTILRVEVPPKTDLNHYFEIMNNRGEQLEKHEVLKARFLDIFNSIQEKELRDKKSHVFHTIWEACSNMEKYVQYGFSVEIRHKLFDKKDWDTFSAASFNDIENQFDTLQNKNHQNKSIDEIINGNRITNQKEETKDESPDRFYSIINFSNFLLQVLQIITEQNISLDDKNLLTAFEKVLLEKKTEEEKIKFAEDFSFGLLKIKYLFDKFIIKRDNSKDKEEWSLLKMKNSKQNKGNAIAFTASYPICFEDNLNKHVIQLLSMFHVSTPTLSYKYWLNAALNYLHVNSDTTAEDYIIFLEKTSKMFVFNRIIADNPKEYFDMIFYPMLIENAKWNEIESTIDESKFSYSKITNNLLFNYVDYLLWKRELKKDTKVRNNKIVNFKFTARSSVEHYYPQNPNEDSLEKLTDEKVLNCFGNLCLIRPNKNSSLSNFSPLSKKKEFYRKDEIDSIKQTLMFEEAENWGVETILEHERFIFQLLKDCMTSN